MGFFDIIKNFDFIEIVNEKDEVIGFQKEDYIHQRGLRHRAIGLIITDKTSQETGQKILISFNFGLYDLPLKNHPKYGQSYESSLLEIIKNSTLRFINDEIRLTEIARYKNDSEKDLENFCLFHFIYGGIIEDTKNTNFIWIDKSELIKDFIKYKNYSHSLKNAFRHFYKRE
jgi:hypothetical protein